MYSINHNSMTSLFRKLEEGSSKKSAESGKVLRFLYDGLNLNWNLTILNVNRLGPFFRGVGY